jgi:hypothetical protein
MLELLAAFAELKQRSNISKEPIKYQFRLKQDQPDQHRVLHVHEKRRRNKNNKKTTKQHILSESD